MHTATDFARKQKKYMPVFPKATGKPTVYIEGYPYEDDTSMPAIGSHGEQLNIFYEQLSRYYAIHPEIYVGVDNFIYYRDGDMTKVVAPDVYVVLGTKKYPLRRSFYTWSEGAVPTTVFEFLSSTTAGADREGKVEIYLREMGVQEYFIHQPDLGSPSEFRGWRRSVSGDIVALAPDAEGKLFSASLNLYFRWEARVESDVRLLRPYLEDGTPITTSMEEHQLRVNAEALAKSAEVRAESAETLAASEAQQRRELEAELERLRRQLASRG